MLRRRNIPLFVIVAAVGCAEPVAAIARPIAGCYRLQATSLAEGSPSIAPLPDTVRLLEARGALSLEDGRSLLRAWPDSQHTPYRWSWWEVAVPDTLTLVFTTGVEGARLVLRPAGDGFTGAMWSFADAGPVPSAATPARLRPVTCVEGA